MERTSPLFRPHYSTMPMIQNTIQTVTDSGLRDPLKILVGGAPVTQEYAAEVGADGFAPDAGSACKLVKSLVHPNVAKVGGLQSQEEPFSKI